MQAFTCLVLALLLSSAFLGHAQVTPLPDGTPVGPGRRMSAPSAPAPPLAEPPRPERPRRKPVDLSDRRACVLELADLCTHPFVVNRFGGANMHGSAFTAEAIDDDLTARELDATVRFDHLAESSDEEILKLVRQARPLIEDTWRFCRDAQYYGWNRRYREQFNIEQHLALKTMAATFNWIVDDASLSDRSDWFPAIPGRMGMESPDREERRAERERISAKDGEKYMANYGEALDQWQKSMDLNKIWQARYDLFCQARGLVYDKLTALWDEELIPRLEASNTTAQKLVGPNYNEPLVDFGLRSASFKCMVSLRNISGHTLSNVVVELECLGYFGDVSHWRGFLPVFPASARIYALPQDGTARLMDRAETDWKAKGDVYADGGKQTIIEMLDYNHGNELLQYQLSHPGVPRPANQGVSPFLKQQRDGFAKTNQDLLIRAPAFLVNLRTNYPAPVNPDAARAKLLPALKPDADYRIIPPENKKWNSETLHLGRINDASAVVDIKVTAISADDGQASEFQLKGRFNEDVDSGCVLGIASPEDSAEHAREFPAPYIRLVTSPIDLISCAQDRSIAGGDGSVEQPDGVASVLAAFAPGQNRNSALKQYKLLLQRERAHQVLCRYVIYLDKDGKLGLQSFSEEAQECAYSKLEPAEKK